MTDVTTDPSGRLELVRDRDRPAGFTLRFDGTDQSYVDLDDPSRLEFDYVRRIADVVDLVRPAGEPVRAVHVGGAGLTVPRYVLHTRPRSSQVVLEPDEAVTAFVRAHLAVPRRSGIRVRPVAGREGLVDVRDDAADVVVVDAFAGSRVPADLVTVESFAQVRRVVGGQGIAVLNLADRAPFSYTGRVVAAARREFGSLLLSAEPPTLKGRRFGNVLLIASSGALPVDALRRRAATSVFPYRVLDDREVGRRFGTAVPFVDADTAPSPAPPSGPAAFR